MQRILTKRTSVELRQNLQKQALIIGSFFLGCIIGGTISHFIGLSSMILPGILILYFWIRRKELILVDDKKEMINPAHRETASGQATRAL